MATHDGRFYAATVLSGVKPGMRAFDEEVFGPVACIVTFATEAEAIELTNNSDYGLAAGVISANTGRAVRIADELDVGMVHVNDQTVNGGPFAPFGGPRKSGNGTRIGGPADIENSPPGSGSRSRTQRPLSLLITPRTGMRASWPASPALASSCRRLPCR
ncbi:aldehyde dehydrogenase family protein [Rhizobium beringeri]